MKDVCMRVLEGNIDIIGIAETKLGTTMPCVVHTCHQSVRGYFDNSKLIIASSTINDGGMRIPEVKASANAVQDYWKDF
jgi:hypothetical protein